MNTTAVSAEMKQDTILFISNAHEKFFYEKMKKVRSHDVYHRALIYCLGMNSETRNNADEIYNFKTGLVNPECLQEAWQTSGSAKVIRLAFNLYCNGTPGAEQIEDVRAYTVEELFCCEYAPFFWQAIKLRYPEFAKYNRRLKELMGGTD